MSGPQLPHVQIGCGDPDSRAAPSFTIDLAKTGKKAAEPPHEHTLLSFLQAVPAQPAKPARQGVTLGTSHFGFAPDQENAGMAGKGA